MKEIAFFWAPEIIVPCERGFARLIRLFETFWGIAFTRTDFKWAWRDEDWSYYWIGKEDYALNYYYYCDCWIWVELAVGSWGVCWEPAEETLTFWAFPWGFLLPCCYSNEVSDWIWESCNKWELRLVKLEGVLFLAESLNEPSRLSSGRARFCSFSMINCCL